MEAVDVETRSPSIPPHGAEAVRPVQNPVLHELHDLLLGGAQVADVAQHLEDAGQHLLAPQVRRARVDHDLHHARSRVQRGSVSCPEGIQSPGKELRPVHWTVSGLRIVGVESRRLCVVPVRKIASRRVRFSRVVLEGQEVVEAEPGIDASGACLLPIKVARSPLRQVRMDARRANREKPRIEIRDIACVHVEPVERSRQAIEHVEKRVWVHHVVARGREEGSDRIDLPKKGGALHHERDRGSLDRRRCKHRPVVRSTKDVPRYTLIGRARRRRIRLRRPGVRSLEHRRASSVVEVARRCACRIGAVHFTEAQQPHIGDVVPGRGRAPGVVDAATDDHIRKPRKRHAPAVDATPLLRELDEKLWRKISRLRTEHRDRIAVLGLIRVHEDRVRHGVGKAVPVQREPNAFECGLGTRVSGT